MTLTLNIHEAQIQLVQLLKRARQGEEIIIIEAGRPVARLVLIDKPTAPRAPGSAAGQVVIADDFDMPLPESILGAFEHGNWDAAPA
jgi:prevent-host-death family protein